MKIVELTNGGVAFVDDQDFDRLRGIKWRRMEARYGRQYACTTTHPRKYLHRVILNLRDPKQDVDHANGNGLDCRRENLRKCTRSQNNGNARKWQKKTTSRFKGVSWFRPAKLWRAYIGAGKNRIWLGYFKTEEDAAKAYDVAAKTMFETFAKTNF